MIAHSLTPVACHPGFAKTELERHLDPVILEKMTFMEAWKGSLSTLMAAIGSDVAQGDYFGRDGPGEISGFPAIGEIDASARDTAVAKQLWDVGKSAAGVIYP